MTNKEFFIQCWQNELPRTVNLLTAMPEADKLSYRPAPKNRSAKELVNHIVAHVEDLIEATKDGVLNHRALADYGTTENAIKVFEEESARLVDLLNKTDDGTWDNSSINMNVLGNKIMDGSLGTFCWMFLYDVIHHRGQLSTYVRPMGGVQPMIYGPTAEMTEAMIAQMASAN